jgi:hypothetical protein
MGMTPEQFKQLLDLLEKMANRTYTLTGAADYPILVVCCSVFIGFVAFIWMDLKNTIKENKGEWREELDKHRDENDKGHDLLWSAMKDCKADCCPARRGKE